MAKKLKKTNAARILDGLGIGYEIKTYEVDEDDLSAVHVAQVSGLDIKTIFKTLVARGDKIICIPRSPALIEIFSNVKARLSKYTG